MARTSGYVVMFFLTVALALVAVSCAAPETSRPLYVESSFTDEEAAAIVQAIDAWNAVGREYVGEELIDYRGRWTDPNGFDPVSDLGDDRAVVYNASLVEAEVGESAEAVGVGLGHDVLMFPEKLRGFMDDKPDDEHLATLRHVAEHELGHWLGLPDVTDPDVASVMFHSLAQRHGATEYDVRNICSIYGCVREP